jgi:DinB superfamily
MVAAQSLKEKFDEKAAAMQSIVAGVSEEKASQRPAEGEWCVRDVLCHLSGDAQHTFRDDLNCFLEEEMPELGVTPGELYWTPGRQGASVQELARSVAAQYRDIGTFVAGLSAEQLARPARIAFLKQVRGNDEIKLSEWIGLIVEYHLSQHIDQLQALAK